MSMQLALDNITIFWMQLLISYAVCTIVVVWYIWPSLTKLSRNSALIPLLVCACSPLCGNDFIGYGHDRS
jgi:hypothetical protein